VVSFAVSQIPREKVYMGIPNYGYDWTLPFERGNAAQTIGNQAAVRRAERYGAAFKFDEKSQSPFFEYYLTGIKQIVWVQDGRTLQASLAIADEFNLPGVGYWTVMRPYNQNWAFISTKYNVRKVL
jgi:spore germination protein